MNIKILLGKKLKEVRKSKKMTQEQLAESINVETSTISNIENGRYYPSAENLDKILSILKINPFNLLISEYNDDSELLLNEMVKAMNDDEKLIRTMYKFYMTIKYNN